MEHASKKGTPAAVELVERIIAQPDERSGNIGSFTELEQYAKDNGYELQRHELRDAFKTVADRYLEQQGVPAWIRARMPTAIHD